MFWGISGWGVFSQAIRAPSLGSGGAASVLTTTFSIVTPLDLLHRRRTLRSPKCSPSSPKSFQTETFLALAASPEYF